MRCDCMLRHYLAANHGVVTEAHYIRRIFRARMQKLFWKKKELLVFSVVVLVIVFILLFYDFVKIDSNRPVVYINPTMVDQLAKLPNDVEEENLIDYLASNILVNYNVIRNYGFDANLHEISLKNEGTKTVPAKSSIKWSIYFNHMHLPEYDFLKLFKFHKLPDCDFLLTHIDGSLSKFSPTEDFQGLAPGETTAILFHSFTTVSRCYIYPRWYIAAPGHLPVIIHSTDDDSRKFVKKFEKIEQWKRSAQDFTNPFSLAKRFETYFATDLTEAPLNVIPTPLHCKVNTEKRIQLDSGKWVVCNNPKEFRQEIKRFSDVFGVKLLLETEPCPPYDVVTFHIGNVEGVPESDEAYQIVIDVAKPSIDITAKGSTGAFYAIQSLLSLAEIRNGKMQHSFPALTIKDAPRYSYRGFHMDVARNFIQADHLINIIETAALYKLNVLHLHLTDDEGWRIEIDRLPELTEVGAVRRHTDDEHDALFPALGSGPHSDTSGTGFYSISDYKRILKVASSNHIRVIPEVDTPGHCHAAIRAMEARYRRLIQLGKRRQAEEFLLNDPSDKSDAISVQHYRNNAINPCMNSTYKFVDHIVTSFKKMHSSIQPLEVIHVGGDEVAPNSWRSSSTCKKFIKENVDFPTRPSQLQEHFIRNVAEICGKKHGLTMAVWEDGALKMPGDIPYDKSAMHGTDVITYAWNNKWEGSSVERAYKLANAGYKVVMSHATHLYFDHPQEPDPEELGLVWATRYIDDMKVFDFRPDDLYGNAKYDSNGAPYSAEEMDRIRDSHPALTKPENIIGMQLQLWSELLSDVTKAHSQLFPRLIAFAERAWHRAEWEYSDSRDMRGARNKEWQTFANVVGYKELPRLTARGINFRIPPPGVKVTEGRLEVCSLYPGFKYFKRPINEVDASDWTECKTGDPINYPVEFYEFMTSDGHRSSRIVQMT